MNNMRKFLISIGLLLLCSSQFLAADNNLPDIGGPAEAELSVSKELEFGKFLVNEVRGSLPISNDPELSQYLQSLGTRITSSGLNSNYPFTFLLVIDKNINAFALPGGIIAVNSGLIKLGEQESEVASVVAHEIAHVTQRHIARNFEKSKSSGVFSALTVLGAILAASYGGGELGQAAIVGSTAAQQQSRLAYSRSFEEEADRIGMQLMVSANIDPQGMPIFFRRLNNFSKLNQSYVPEFLRSHPLTTRRISESQTRADQYKGNYSKNTMHFDYARARLIAITDNPARKINELKKKSAINGGLSDVENYTYAGVLTRAGKFQDALKRLKKIPLNVDNELTVKLGAAQVYISARQFDYAIEILEPLTGIYPNNVAITYYLATSLIEKNQGELALRMLDQLKLAHSNPAIDKLKAKAASNANMPWRSHEALGDFYAANARYNASMEQLQLATRSSGINANTKARIEAKKVQLREFRQRRDNFKP